MLLGCLAPPPTGGAAIPFAQEFMNIQGALATPPNTEKLLQQLTEGTIEAEVLCEVRAAWGRFKDLKECCTLEYYNERLLLQRTLVRALPLYLTGIALYWGHPFSRWTSVSLFPSLSSLQTLVMQPKPFGPLWHRIQRMLPRLVSVDRHVIAQRQLCPTLYSPAMLAALGSMVQVMVAALIFLHTLLSARNYWLEAVLKHSDRPHPDVLTMGMSYFNFLFQAYDQHKTALAIFSGYLRQQDGTLDTAALSMLQRIGMQLRLTGSTADFGLGEIEHYLRERLGWSKVADGLHEVEWTRVHTINAESEYLQIFSQEFAKSFIFTRPSDGLLQSYGALSPEVRADFELSICIRSRDIQEWVRTWEGLSRDLQLPFQPGSSWKVIPIASPILPSARDFEFARELLTVAQYCRALHAIRGGLNPCHTVVDIGVVHGFLWLVGKHLRGWKDHRNINSPSASGDPNEAPLLICHWQREEQYKELVSEFEAFARRYFMQLDPLPQLRYIEHTH